MTDNNLGRKGSPGNIMKALGTVIGLLRDILAELKKANSRTEPQQIVYKDHGFQISGDSLDGLAKEVADQLKVLDNNRKPGNKGYNNNKARGN